jgi:GNAT superfamily N-acetyltransferase
MSTIAIYHLYETQQLIPEVAHWIYKEFWFDKPGFSPQFFEGLLRNAAQLDSIPLSLLAFVNEVPVGTINLIENDDEKRPHLRPWLAALYVKPEFRKQGVGSSLVNELLSNARRLGIQNLYLGTYNPNFYKKLGATIHEQINPKFAVMSFVLG